MGDSILIVPKYYAFMLLAYYEILSKQCAFFMSARARIAFKPRFETPCDTSQRVGSRRDPRRSRAGSPSTFQEGRNLQK